MEINGCVFFWPERNGSGMSGMRTVSLFGSSGGKAGAGRNEADKGFEADGRFGGWKKFVDEISLAAGPALDGDEMGVGGLLVPRTGN